MNNSIDQQFIEFVVKSLVNNPDDVQIERTIDEKGVLLELTVNPEDLGRVIGKRGATAQSLRTLLRALGTKNDARYNLKIIDNGEPRERRQPTENNEESVSYAPAPSPQSSDDNTVAQDDDDLPEVAAVPDHEDVLSKTRKELEDLDDLDV
ncbi:MAG: KH domain-containing protein [Patescibacteria group bacterium]